MGVSKTGKVVITIKVDEELKKRLDEVARNRRTSRNSLIVEAIEEYLNTHGSEMNFIIKRVRL